ncbi:protein O-linked-mannose beta-1,4-N-acetylglucosaminyltransferase 2 [Aplysia californica]|uniref:Protein O-linked-mannose beta-1,4-N-acetylglucosaminyltransferase 2 n=1 Tax=Aplysia californica TaxID=6500 RepID=A0ABM0JFW4_APLCA|nr:protein O-linked-mannose beta-1,4-N-acetylglucosaminyltransferase 2 [Aplysia californica]XP_005092757.1 protein O-linked-mannose beta-1,4-N-acetylglucosaminyltransferase 2 [Aplysia californica]
MATSSIQGIVHVVMLVAIIVFASQYHQLGLRYEELLQACKGGHSYKEYELTENRESSFKPRRPVEESGSKYHTRSEDLLTSSSAVEPGLGTRVSQMDLSVDVYQGTEKIQLGTSQLHYISQSPLNSDQIVFHATDNFLSTSKHTKLQDKETVSLDSVTSVVDVPVTSEPEQTNPVTSLDLWEHVKTQPTAPASGSDSLTVSFVFSSSSLTEQQHLLKNTEYINRNVFTSGPRVTADDSLLNIDDAAKADIVLSDASVDSIITTPTSISLSQFEAHLKSSQKFENFGSTELHDSDFDPLYYEEDFESDSYLDDYVNGVGENRINHSWEDSEAPVKEQLSGFDECEQTNSQSNTKFDYCDTQTYKRPSFSKKMLKYVEVLSAADREKLGSEGTSVWCSDLDRSGSSCHIQNLCYNTAQHDFVFLKSDTSIIEASSQEFYEGQISLSLSAIPDHNAYIFRPVTIPGKSVNEFSVSIMRKTTFLMSRFKPDNIMHVFHDDLFPLIHTLDSMKFQRRKRKFDVVIMFADHYDEGDLLPLYSSVSTESPITLWKSNFPSDLVCFESVYLGLSNKTLWYQYGFSVPQGPLHYIDKFATGVNVYRAARYAAQDLLSDCIFCSSGSYLVLLSRKDTRLIVNEGELILAVARATKLKVMSVSLETHSLAELVTIVKNSKGILGMHGSLFSLAAFLPPGSVVIELFPYAVNPSKYTPFKSLCELGGYSLIYRSWTNPSRDNSVPHPGWPSDVGGIHHLSPEAQQEISSQTEVPNHLCCEDPSWLYHIYQDTVVDIDSVVTIAASALSQAEVFANSSRMSESVSGQDSIIPGAVSSLLCNLVDNSFTLSWTPPWNVEFVSHQTFTYHLVFQERGTEMVHDKELPSSVTKYSLQHKGNHREAEFNIWLRAVFDGTRKGPPSFVTCKVPR